MTRTVDAAAEAVTGPSVRDVCPPGPPAGPAHRADDRTDRSFRPIDATATTTFDWDYEGGRDGLLRLYDKGTRKQWLAKERLDWSIEVDRSNPLGLPDDAVAINGSPVWEKMSDAERAEYNQGPGVNAYVMQDEARHVAFGRRALRDHYPQLTDAERDEREEFCVEA